MSGNGSPAPEGAVVGQSGRRPSHEGCQTRDRAAGVSTRSGGPCPTSRPSRRSRQASAERAASRSCVACTTVVPSAIRSVSSAVMRSRGLGVESGGRLVQEQQVGLLGQALGDQDALALPAGQLAELAGGEVVDAQSFHGGVDHDAVLPGQPPPRAPLVPAAHLHRLPGREGERVAYGAALRDEGRRAAFRVAQLSGCGIDHPGEDAEQGGLPAAVRPDERRHGQRRYIRGELTEDRTAGVARLQIAEPDAFVPWFVAGRPLRRFIEHDCHCRVCVWSG
ncbi:hypothetical protein RKD44_001554 [Streptomyces collinus]